MKCVNHNKAKIYIKMSKNLSAKYYQENKERLQKKKKKKKKNQNFSIEEKAKKRQNGRECYKNLLEEQKRKLVEYRKKYFRIRKNMAL